MSGDITIDLYCLVPLKIIDLYKGNPSNITDRFVVFDSPMIVINGVIYGNPINGRKSIGYWGVVISPYL